MFYFPSNSMIWILKVHVLLNSTCLGCWLPSLTILNAIKIYRKYFMCQNILYYWHYKQKRIVICFEAFNFYCERAEDFTIVCWLDICSKQGSHFIFLSNIYHVLTFKKLKQFYSEDFIRILVQSLIKIANFLNCLKRESFLIQIKALHWQLWLYISYEYRDLLDIHEKNLNPSIISRVGKPSS